MSRIHPGFLRALGIPLVEGRGFSDGDRADTPPVVIVNRSFARAYLNGETPVGHRLGLDSWRLLGDGRAEIVGVAEDVRHDGLLADVEPLVYVPFAQRPEWSAPMIVKTRGDPLSFLPAVREAAPRASIRPRRCGNERNGRLMLSADLPVERVALRGRRIALEPLCADHLPGLATAIRDGELWSIPVTLVPHPDELPEFLRYAEARYAAQQERAFATIDLETGSIVGSTRFMGINRDHRRVEIGFTFLAQRWQRSHVNTEAKYLMLRHAFDEWQCNRVELITDALNAKSRQAILRLGAKQEGVLRAHMVMRDGRIRDSVLYSIVRSEWPAVRSGLEARMAAHEASRG